MLRFMPPCSRAMCRESVDERSACFERGARASGRRAPLTDSKPPTSGEVDSDRVDEADGALLAIVVYVEGSMLLKRHIAPAAVVLVAVLGWGCQDRSPSPTSPSPPLTAANPPAPPVPQKTPTHTLTITASPSCTALPAAATQRTYPAQVQEKPNGDIVVLVVNSWDIMIGWANDSGFTGKRHGNTVRFDIVDDLDAGYAMIERIPGVGDMGYFGTATGTIDANGNIVATFEGEYRLGYGMGPVLCQAPDHHIEVTRTGG